MTKQQATTAAVEHVVRRLYEEVWTLGDLTVLDDLLAEDVVSFLPGPPQPSRGVDAYRETVEQFRVAFPDIRFGLDDIVADGGVVAARYTMRGTHEADLLGVPASNRSVEMRGVAFATVVDGKIAEIHDSADTLNLLFQVGGMPASAA
ncbi:ester cyclase [Haloarchaeobius sp. DFWS5]|uniref:ester cyclase n=1 Tax=Haloarchaeobius sp. DFWS5 TaxID=3446114 RepID=UPI003EBA97D3